MTCSTCTHEHPLSTFTEKQPLAAFYAHTGFLLQCLFAELCKNQQPHLVEGLCQPSKGSGLTEWSPVKCAFSEHSKTSTNLPSEPRDNAGITQGWHWAGIPSQRQYRGPGPCVSWSSTLWGSLITLLIRVIMWALHDLLLCSTQVQTTDIKKLYFQKNILQ